MSPLLRAETLKHLGIQKESNSLIQLTLNVFLSSLLRVRRAAGPHGQHSLGRNGGFVNKLPLSVIAGNRVVLRSHVTSAKDTVVLSLFNFTRNSSPKIALLSKPELTVSRMKKKGEPDADGAINISGQIPGVPVERLSQVPQ